MPGMQIVVLRHAAVYMGLCSLRAGCDGNIDLSMSVCADAIIGTQETCRSVWVELVTIFPLNTLRTRP